MNKAITVFIGFVLLSTLAPAQEMLMPLLRNPRKAAIENRPKAEPAGPKQLSLPFRDDFSYPGPFPEASLWADSSAFINNSFAVHPKTVGVATFDALDQYGGIYEAAHENAYQFVADHLTSQQILLGSLAPADSVLLSFYYQPQGNGSAPRGRDSLVLEFLRIPGYFDENEEGETVWIPDEWESVWRATGEDLSNFSGDDFPYFKRVALFITDPAFFRDDFRFRFKNYSSFSIETNKTPVNMAGNNNIWNIDYVLLDQGRSVFNDTYFDIAFADGASSILKRYSAMPWSHYIVNSPSHLKSNLELKITNLGGIVYNYVYRYFIQDESGTNIRTYSGGTWNIAPFFQDGYQNYQPHTNPIVIQNPLPTAPAAERHFKVVHIIREGVAGDSYQRNDTIAFDQVFQNYFAYDDGVPESGYGLAGRNARGAYRFILSKTDTLEAVQFLFNRTLTESNDIPFYLTIWKNLEPEEILYQSEVQSPDFEDSLNGFVTYLLDEPIQVSDTIYVGWEQLNEGFLNLGYDANGQAGENIFYNVGNEWVPSIYEGALMIRPYFGPETIVGVELPQLSLGVNVFPNPVRHDLLNIRLDDRSLNPEEVRLEVYDISGRLLLSREYATALDVSAFSNGMYLLRLTHPQQQRSQSLRFIIAR
ncbi:MAG: T9SS type A sorting domain-containing protein [Bacteroides sp.]|nr:T9SS type A sorting domain-containing protein [Bacteroides sp.]